MNRHRYGGLVIGLAVAASFLHACADSTRPPNPDSVPPDPVTDLRVLVTGDSSITLTWTAPGDDGMKGRAARYEFRQSWAADIAYYWVHAIPLDTTLVPREPGLAETLRVDHLNGRYFFVLRTFDEAGNGSLVSNVTGLDTGDRTPPAVVQDLSVIDTDAGSVVLTWTAPGDDGREGAVSGYDIRYGPAVSLSLWKGLARATPPSGPFREGGEAETTRVDGLESDSEYEFALMAEDESGNWSAMSNVAHGATRVDTDPPGDITDLHVVDVTGRFVVLGWTAPGDDGERGTVTSYDVRYAQFPIDDGNWETAETAPGPPYPRPAGVAERIAVYYLMPNTSYSFAIKAVDEAGNRSPLSNVVTATTGASGGEWHVLPDGSGDFPTIQAAIDSVPAGDLILVAPGTYPECLNFGDKDVVVRGEDGPEATILAGCGDPGRALVHFGAGTTRVATLEGFTVTGAAGGEAIRVNSGSPTLQGNIIKDINGIGVDIRGGEAVVRGNQFLNDGNAGVWGGGVVASVSSAGGGGYPDSWSAPLIEDNLFDGNRGRFGGAIRAAYTRAIIRHNTFRNNTCGYDGGAIFLYPTTDNVLVENNAFYHNVAGDHGGAIAAWNYQAIWGSGWADIRGNLMVDNEALGEDSQGVNGIGGAIHVSGINGTITNNTIVRNHAGFCGGGGITLYLDTGDGPWIIERNIIALNTDGGLTCFQGDASRVRDNLLFGNAYDFGCKPGICDSTVISANVVADPLFCDPEGGDWRVAADSPALTDPAGPIGAYPNPGCSLPGPR